MSQKKKMELKIGIVGCGNIAKVHLRYILQYIDKGNISLCDSDALRLEEFAKVFNINNTFNELNAMLSSFKPDVVHILTPPFTHKTIAEECLKNGCHVLIEKPVCISLEELSQIDRTACENKRMACVDHMRLFDPLILKAEGMVKSGQLGAIINISAEYSYDFFQREDIDAASRWIKDLPGGAFFDTMAHPLCVIDKFLPGLKLEKSVTVKNSRGLDNELWCVFTFLDKTATLHMSLSINPLVNCVEIECTNGFIKIDLRNFLLVVRKKHSLPNLIERIVGNFSVAMQIICGTIGSIFKFLSGKLDPYSGLNTIIKNLYASAVSENGVSPVPHAEVKRLLALMVDIFPYQKLEIDKNLRQKEALSDADFLITGGTGFIGRRLVNKLIEKGYRVRVLSHRELNENEIKKIFNGKVEVIKGNIYSLEDVKKACFNVKKVIHLAAASKGDWNYHLDTTITGTRNILEAADSLKVESVIYVSTINVYDAKKYPHNRVINEDFAYEDLPERRGNYSHAKLRAEKFVKEFIKKSQMPISIVRPGLVYGPGKQAFLQDIGYRIGKRLVVVIGSGNRRLPLVYVDNLVDALVMIAQKKEGSREVFNVVDCEYPTQHTYMKAYKKLTNERLLVLNIPRFLIYTGFWIIERLASFLFKKKVFLNYKLQCIAKNVTHSTDRLKNQIGWEQKINFNEGLALTIKAMSDD